MTNYIHLSSTDNVDIFPNNVGSNFTSLLPNSIDNLVDDYEMALCYIQGPLPSVYNVFCDVIEQNVIKGQTLPVLRHVLSKRDFPDLQFIKVAVPRVSRIRIFLTDLNLKPLKTSGTVRCTLCLRKRPIKRLGISC